DVRFEAPRHDPPDVAPARLALERWLDEAVQLLPRREPDDCWDPLQQAIRRLRYQRDIVGWDDPIDFLNALLDLPTSARITQKRWADDAAGKARAKDLAEEYAVMMTDGGDRKSTRLNSSHVKISYAVFCLK